jgi:hypothetical protein
MTRKILVRSLALFLGLALANGSTGAAGEGALDPGMTPLGAERAGNKDGSIPAWQGAEPPLPGWAPGKRREDFWKHRGEQALFSIDGKNADQYADKLSPGQLALLKQVPGYRMNVYPSHRSCGVPDFVADNTRNNIGFASLQSDGWSLKDAYLPGTPFPVPANGAQAMWNAKLHYRGVLVNFPAGYTVVSPAKGSTAPIRAGYDQTVYLPWATKGSQMFSKLDPVEFYTYFAFQSPATLAGQATIFTIFTAEPSQAFAYFPGQRRVRRLPSYAYDTPLIGFENQYTVDESFMHSGLLDRFEWKLIGKKELYVQYNAFGGYDFPARLENVALPNAVDANHRRYELHRVWVVEATVKPNARHNAPKRTYYLDEDSWTILLAEDRDAQGKLWKVRESFPIPVYELSACDNPGFVQYNLTDGRYVFDLHGVGNKDIQWAAEPNSARAKPDFYTQENLRIIGER